MLELTPTPIANSFPDYPDSYAKRYPLAVQECLECGHVQLKHQVSVDWVDYRYQTPEASRPHLADAADAIRTAFPFFKTAIEIGSNNGIYLEELRRVGFEVIGIDPNAKVGIAAPFTHDLAKKLEPVDLIVANNVLAHVDDMYDVFNGIDRVLTDDGALIFEVQYFPDMMASGAFDMIYHEHRDYHTMKPLPRFLKRFGLVIEQVDFIETHGGSLRVWCRRPGLGLDVDDMDMDWRAFKHKIDEARRVLIAQLDQAKSHIVALGATAKACTLIHHFGLTDYIDYAVDSTPQKQGRYIPGTDIEIHRPDVLKNDPDAVVLLTAWNFADVIVPQFPDKQFIIPFAKPVEVLA
jgi:SAM-dependent methyltransferase